MRSADTIRRSTSLRNWDFLHWCALFEASGVVEDAPVEMKWDLLNKNRAYHLNGQLLFST